MQNVNYPSLRKLLEQYQSLGFQVFAFPSNQFGAQAPASSDCERAYIYKKVGFNGTFPVFDKVLVNGEGSSPVYTFLKGQTPSATYAGWEVSWNYEKFLVDEKGQVKGRWFSGEDPLKAEPQIKEFLGLS